MNEYHINSSLSTTRIRIQNLVFLIVSKDAKKSTLFDSLIKRTKSTFPVAHRADCSKYQKTQFWRITQKFSKN